MMGEETACWEAKTYTDSSRLDHKAKHIEVDLAVGSHSNADRYHEHNRRKLPVRFRYPEDP